jgi:protein transport protein SEC61 subunit alpha
VLVGAKILDVDLVSGRDAQLYMAAQKVLGIVICLGSSVAYVLSGVYGPVSTLGAFTAFAIIAQLFVAGLVVVMLDDLLQKGYGICGGLNLFLVTNICENVVWQMLSPMTISQGGQMQFEGAVVAVFHLLITSPNKLEAVRQIFMREGLPNLSNVIATVLVFLIVIYVEGLKHTIRLTSPTAGSMQQEFPIKLFYTSNMPIIILSGVIGQTYFFSQVMFKRYPTNPIVRLLGIWSEDVGTGRSRPIWGVSYIISPPESVFDLAARPLHSLFYVGFMLLSCGFFAKMWIELSNSGPLDVYKTIQKQYGPAFGHRDIDVTEIRNAKVVLAGKQQGKGGKPLLDELKRVVPLAALVGGMCIALLSITADLFGAIGTGTGILMAVTIIFDIFARLEKDAGPGGVAKLVENLMAGREE